MFFFFLCVSDLFFSPSTYSFNTAATRLRPFSRPHGQSRPSVLCFIISFFYLYTVGVWFSFLISPCLRPPASRSARPLSLNISEQPVIHLCSRSAWIRGKFCPAWHQRESLFPPGRVWSIHLSIAYLSLTFTNLSTSWYRGERNLAAWVTWWRSLTGYLTECVRVWWIRCLPSGLLRGNDYISGVK